MVDDISKDVYDIDLTAVISEVNLVGSNPKEWWIDTCATCYVTPQKYPRIFIIYSMYELSQTWVFSRKTDKL